MKPKNQLRKPDKCYHLVWKRTISGQHEVCDGCGTIRKVEKSAEAPKGA